MTSKQYKNIVNMTLNDVKNEKNIDSAELARRILNNCGVSFPNAGVADIAEALASEDYMGWRKCSAAQAIEYANSGTPVVGIDLNGVTVVVPNDEENQQEQEATITCETCVVHASNFSTQGNLNVQYYAYYAATTNSTKAPLRITGCPEGNLYVNQSFMLFAWDDRDNSLLVKWEYDKNKFIMWEDVMLDKYYAYFIAKETGATTIKATTYDKDKKAYSCSIERVITTLETVKFDANGGCISQKSQNAARGNKITLPTPTYDSDHIFMGWFTGKENTDKAGNAGERYTVRCSTTLYAQWLFLRKRILSKNACYLKGGKHDVKGIMVHSTAAPNSSVGRYVPRTKSAENAKADNEPVVDCLLQEYTKHWNTAYPDGRSVCVHAFIGKLNDGRIAVYQTLPWEMPGWHSGSYKNSGKDEESADDLGYIGFEICEDQTDDAYLKAAYHEAVKLCAYLCKKYPNLLVGKSIEKAIISHREGNVTHHIASDHGDPEHWFNPKGYTMDGFRQDVKKMM